MGMGAIFQKSIHIRVILIGVFCAFSFCARAADIPDLNSALRVTYSACVGIDESLTDLKKMAGINTAVTAVGTGLGASATVVGIIKGDKDAQAKKIADKINYAAEQYYVVPNDDEWNAFVDSFKNQKDDRFTELREKSKKLGNWRTGLIAGNTATNVAGAIIASKNKVDDDLQTQIDDCKKAVKILRDSINIARINGEDVAEATEIANTCREFEYIDITPINKRGKGAMISSVVGATTGLAGTVTSVMANTENVRKDADGMNKSQSDWDKEKNINTAANLFAGTSTVASGVATVFNATQISAIKKIANVAEKCTGVLK